MFYYPSPSCGVARGRTSDLRNVMRLGLGSLSLSPSIVVGKLSVNARAKIVNLLCNWHTFTDNFAIFFYVCKINSKDCMQVCSMNLGWSSFLKPLIREISALLLLSRSVGSDLVVMDGTPRRRFTRCSLTPFTFTPAWCSCIAAFRPYVRPRVRSSCT